MGISLKLDPISIDIVAALGDVQSPTLRSAMLAEFAREEIAKASAINRKQPQKTVVDGRQTADLGTVKPDGTIVATWSLIEDVLKGIGDALVAASPMGGAGDDRPGHPGLYAASHVLLADGEAVDDDSKIPQAQTYAFLNTQPYARKIERGLSNQAPEGVYQTVATMMSQRFSNIAQIRFGYLAPLFGAVHAWGETTTMQSPGRKGRQRAEWLRRQPAIIITPR